jgi:hypothetical protein
LKKAKSGEKIEDETDVRRRLFKFSRLLSKKNKKNKKKKKKK